MDPVSIISGLTSLIGIGTSIFGATKNYEAADQANSIQKTILGEQSQENTVRQNSAAFMQGRQQLENLRNVQRAQAAGVAAGTSQGGYAAGTNASGVAGGQAQATDQGAFANLGITTQFGFGTQLYDLQQQITGNQINLSDANTALAKAQGISNIGGAITNAAGGIGKLAGNFFGKSS